MHQQVPSGCVCFFKVYPKWSFHCPCCRVVALSPPALASSTAGASNWFHCFSLVLTLTLPPCGRPCHLPAGTPSVTSVVLDGCPESFLPPPNTATHPTPLSLLTKHQSHGLSASSSDTFPPSCLRIFALFCLPGFFHLPFGPWHNSDITSSAKPSLGTLLY